MYDIRQFRPVLYILIVLGLTGFALASQSPGLWVLSVSAILLNAWLVKTNRFRPLPRLIANVVTVLGLLVLASVVRQGASTPILVIGQFLVLLQLVKLYEQRSNRDYAQLLVLSLLLMVAASISTASLIFGIMLIAYLFLSLYCCLLFHLKVETDHARQAIGIPEDKLNPATLRQDQRYLSRSMRRLTLLVSSFAVTTAVLTFLLFPRGSGAGLLTPLQWRPAPTLTGFSDSVSFQNVARITQNTQHVAYVSITRNGSPYRLPGPLLLRGVTLDRYSGKTDTGNSFQWTRTLQDLPAEEISQPSGWRRTGASVGEDVYVQKIRLEPTGTTALFAIAGVVEFSPQEVAGYSFRYWRQDEVLQANSPIIQPIQYEVSSSGRLTVGSRPRWLVGVQAERALAARAQRPPIDPRILEFARRPEVSGTDGQGPLVARRPVNSLTTQLDEAIAANIERYLRSNFSYTLDLTDALRIEGEDPMVAFLYDLKRGHCEYFAGAMALMCQSLGMQARVVVGFKCDDYNTLGNYYDVKQSHAHAWVEVLNSRGEWITFDPTSGREATSESPGGFVQQLRSLFNYLEYTWASSVVAYDRDSRSNLFANVDRSLSSTAARSSDVLNRTREWLNENTYVLSSKAISGIIALMVSGMVMAVIWFFVEKWKLRRRARRIGLDQLPAQQQMKLARQLGFYDDLLRLLERYRISRPAHLTPLEFSQSLAFLPVQAFEAIHRLTNIFYRVRYGHAELTPAQRKRLATVIDGVESTLARQQH